VELARSIVVRAVVERIRVAALVGLLALASGPAVEPLQNEKRDTNATSP
jgi:hypothetical protein